MKNYEYTGDCFLTRQVWDVFAGGGMMWEKFRSLYMQRHHVLRGGENRAFFINACIESTVRHLIEDCLEDDKWPLMKGDRHYGFELGPRGDWEEFILSLAKAYIQYEDISYADDDSDIQACAEEAFVNVIEGETVEDFNERLYAERLENAVDCMRDDFDDMKAQLMIAKIGFAAMESGTVKVP